MNTLLDTKSSVRRKRLRRVRLDISGQGLTEYLILLLLISVVSIAAAKGLGKTVSKKLTEIDKSISKEVLGDARSRR